MPLRFADVVNWGDLRDTIIVPGAVRAREHYESGDQIQAAVYGVVALIGLVVTLGGITLGLVLIAD